MSELITVRELAQRQSDKLLITLWWIENSMETYVTVEDQKTQPPEKHTIIVPNPNLALHRFYHPLPHIGEKAPKRNLYAVPEGYDYDES